MTDDPRHGGPRPIDPAAADPPVADSATPPEEPSLPGRRRWILAAVAALGVALFAVPFIEGPDEHTVEHATAAAGTTAVGPRLPNSCPASRGRANLDFTLSDLEGRSVQLADYKGKVILLNFWATWCGPCKVEIPEFVQAYTEHRDRGFVILGVLTDDQAPQEELRAFVEEHRMNYPVLREDEAFRDAFGPLFGLPTSFIIDRHGSICSKHLGAVSKDTLEQELQGLL